MLWRLVAMAVLLSAVSGASNSHCDLACFLGNLTISLGGLSFPLGTIKTFDCTGLTLSQLSSTYVPPTSLSTAVHGLMIHCDLEVHIDVLGTYNLVATSEGSSLAAQMQFLVDNKTGLAGSSHLSSCDANIVFHVQVPNHPVFQTIVDLVKRIYGGRVGKLICGELSTLVDTDMTAVLRSINAALVPFLGAGGGPPPGAPNYGSSALNFTGNPLFGLVDFLLDDLIGANGPFGVNRIMAALTNGTGGWEIDFGENGTVVTTQSVGGLGNVTLGLYRISIAGLTSFDVLNLLVPRDSFSLDSRLELSSLELNVSFFVDTTVGMNGTTVEDPRGLFETGEVRFRASDLTVGLSLSAAIDRRNALTLNLDQLISPGCLAAMVMDGNVTQARLQFALQQLLVVAGSNKGQLEGSLDALIDNLLLLVVTSYNKVIPAFVNAVLLTPAVDAANAAIVANVFETPRPCVLQAVSTYSSSFPVNPTGAVAVLGGAAAAWFGVTALVVALHWARYSKAAQERDESASADEAEARRSSPSPPPPPLSDGAQVGLLSMHGSLNASGGDGAALLKYHRQIRPPPIGLDPQLWWIVKLAVPLLIIANIGLFVVSNTSVGASVFVYIHLGNDTITTSSLFSFTLANSVHDMWVAGVYPLSLIVAIFSGCWPYLKLLAMLLVWLAPVASKLRERILMVLDALGKWSLIDAFVLVFMMVAFRFRLVIPGSPLAQTATGDATIDLLVETDMGFYTFLLATMVSLVITHIILAVHRWLETKHSDSVAQKLLCKSNADDDKRSAVFQAEFPSGSGFKTVKATRRGVVTVALLLIASLGCVIGGALTDSFVFHFGGAAGAVFPYAGVQSDRRYSLVSLALALPGASLNENSFGVRWVQATFLVFAFVVPLCYLAVLLLLWLVPMRQKARLRVFNVAEILRAWSAMEVFVLSVIAALTELEQFAQFLVGDRCDFINPVLHKYFSSFLNGSDKCFDVTTTLTWGCWIMFVACVLYLAVGQVVMSLCHSIVYPDDEDDDDNAVRGEKKLSRKARFLIFLRMARVE